MRKRIFAGFLAALMIVVALPALAQNAPDIQKHPNCKYCGMDRDKFNFSRMLITYSDGSEFGICSIHCAALEFALNLDKIPAAIQVGDFHTKKLIDAEQAVWVIGGKKPGVMTRNAKWAFADKNDADSFIKENGGDLATFEQAMKTTYEDMYADTKMIREKRAKMKLMKEGQK